jgi:hypothetical protein
MCAIICRCLCILQMLCCTSSHWNDTPSFEFCLPVRVRTGGTKTCGTDSRSNFKHQLARGSTNTEPDLVVFANLSSLSML